ncbi:phage antirepressor [Paenibacillus sp. D51F]
MALTSIFSFKSGDVRTAENNGQIWFAARDVCSILEISNVSVAVNGNRSRGDMGLDDDEKGLYNVYTPSGPQQMLCVNESGLYALIGKSRKPEAREFKRWINHEVLPTIRKTGGFVANEDLFLATYLPTADEGTRAMFRQTLEVVRKQNEAIAVMTPKAEAFDAFISADGTQSLDDVAKVIGEGPYILPRKLREAGVLMSSRRRHNVPYQRFIDAGYFVMREVTIDHDTHRSNRATIRVTAKGVEFIRRVLREPKTASAVPERRPAARFIPQTPTLRLAAGKGKTPLFM